MTTIEFNDRLVAAIVANVRKRDDDLATMIQVIYNRLKLYEDELQRLRDVVSSSDAIQIDNVLE